MAIFNFIKTAKHQKYHYEPRYWDPVKEDVLKRVSDLEEMQGSDIESVKKRMAYKMRRRGDAELKMKARKKMMKRYFIRMMFLLALLLMGTYVILVRFLPKLTAIVDKNSVLQ